MDVPGIISAVVGGAASAGMLFALQRAASGWPEVEDGAFELRYPPLFRWGVGIAGALLFGFAIVAFGFKAFGPPDPELDEVIWTAVPIIGVLGAVSLLEIFVRYQVDEEGIRGRTAFRGTRSMRWEDVVEVKFSNTMQWFRLQSSDLTTLRASGLLRGAQALPRVIERYVAPDVAAAALEAYEGRPRGIR
ncbi:MAG: PH domain-containing protein [Planctomycetota bacterium]